MTTREVVVAGFEKEYVLAEANWRRRLARDWRLANHMLRVLWMWLTVGRKLRRASAAAQHEGRQLVIDQLRRGRV
jgi:hypothetical protein